MSAEKPLYWFLSNSGCGCWRAQALPLRVDASSEACSRVPGWPDGVDFTLDLHPPRPWGITQVAPPGSVGPQSPCARRRLGWRSHTEWVGCQRENFAASGSAPLPGTELALAQGSVRWGKEQWRHVDHSGCTRVFVQKCCSFYCCLIPSWAKSEAWPLGISTGEMSGRQTSISLLHADTIWESCDTINRILVLINHFHDIYNTNLYNI